MIEHRRHAIPISFSIFYSNDKTACRVGINRIIDGNKICKYIGIKETEFDKFELYRMLEIVFEFMVECMAKF